ncbi:CPBP family intramembrane glutamic endopeptidase [Salinimicrobium sp. TH3]|uniref:CPBP family intramembrane glutamic endopeptidase n=1 Tax=Salinimicrobium sp. TH3 TaxID=2997342 RepID=UPI00227651D8|nr:type II CAAX endopeptidase family protein [Salinimicrobium sp. TH3]MCY2685952.1 type II CAAX endopeptidase family protein [Salinimicrobium sp. TH3]
MKNLIPFRLLIFGVLLIVLTIATQFLPTDSPLSMFGVMWVPGIAALIATFSTKRKFSEFGWKLNLKWMGYGWLLPILYGGIAYSIIWISGLGAMPKDTFLERARLTLGMDNPNDIVIIISAFFFISILNLLPNMILVLGEELGWRGFLVPEMIKITTFRNTALISGSIWFFWHLPGIISGNYGNAATPLWFQLACFFILVLAGAIILTWLRLKSNSLWPAVIFHAVHNGVIQSFYTNLTADTGNTDYFIGEFGIMVPLVSAVIALYVYIKNEYTQTILPKDELHKDSERVSVL